MAAPGFEAFVEFAVCLSSFSDFLRGKGLSGLHQLSSGLEQQALALFDEVGSHQIHQETVDDLGKQLKGLAMQVTRFIGNNSAPSVDRRAHQTAELPSDLTPTHRVWFVGGTTSQWRALMTQLAYFGIQAEVYPWENVPTDAKEPACLLLDAHAMALEEACGHIKTLRARFSASKLIAHHFSSDFNDIKMALRAGCDFCLAHDTTQSMILARIIELCSNEEESPYRVLVVEDSLTASKSISAH